MIRLATTFFMSLVVAAFCSEAIAQDNAVVRGAVVELQVEAGSFHAYVPKNTAQPTNVLVICHGTISKSETARGTSRVFIDRWLQFAEQTGVILVAPAFDVENYASGESAPGGEVWGYRALDGRTFSSDQFVNAIIERIKTLDVKYDGKFYLYGHSAGAQFANHYLMVHPDRLNGVVLSAPAIYAMPDPSTAWPKGLRTLRRELQWGNVTKLFEISHELETVVAAVQLPIAVVVGTRDTKFMSDQPQQGGSTRFDRGQYYVAVMRQVASDNKVAANIGFVPVKGVGHDSAGLIGAASAALLEMGRQNAARDQAKIAVEPNDDSPKQPDGDK